MGFSASTQPSRENHSCINEIVRYTFYMSPESKHPETPRAPEFTIEYISAEDFFEQVVEKLEELGISDDLEVPLGELLASGFDNSPSSDPPRTELWAYSLDDVAENLAGSIDTPLSYIQEDAVRPAVGIYNPRLFERTPTDATGIHWRHTHHEPIDKALVAIFYPQD